MDNNCSIAVLVTLSGRFV